MTSLLAPERSIPLSTREAEPNPRLIAGSILLFFAALFSISLSGLPQYTDNEWRLSAYVLDVLQNGHWFCPTDANGELISKPPMLVWLATVVAVLRGGVDTFVLYSPTAAAAAAAATLLFIYGRKYFCWRVGLFSSVAYALSYVGLSQMSTARYDGLLALLVTAAALAAFSAWQSGKGWTWFWFFAAVGTLVKGPVALALPAFGLAAYLWERRSCPAELPRFSGSHASGILLFLFITGGWFALAYGEMGQRLVDKMLGRELLGHAVTDGGGALSGVGEPTVAFLGIYAPWSLVAAAGFWRIIARPAMDAQQRRLERFLLLWFVLGLTTFSLAAHQRGRLIYPLIPAAALVAGLQMHTWTSRLRHRIVLSGCGIAAAAFLAGCFAYTHILTFRSSRVQETLAMRELAQRLEATREANTGLIFVSSPMPLKVWLSTRVPDVTPAKAVVRLAGNTPAYVVTKSATPILALLPTNVVTYEVYSWTSRRSGVHILSNRPQLE